MAHRTPAPLRTLGLLVRALLGLALLTALIGGVPYALLTLGHQPTELTGGWNLLTQQDDGTLFLVVLTLLGWAAWAAFAFSTLVEIVSLARRRSSPRIRALAPLQSAASLLIGSIVLLAPTAASAASSPAVAVTATQAVAEADPSASAAPESPAQDDDTDWPEYTVTSATETPWDLSEEYLGSGPRWKDIAALNPGIPELAAGDQYLPQGSVIKLPADARPVAPATSPAGTPSASTAPTTTASASAGSSASATDNDQPSPGEPANTTAPPAEQAPERPESVTADAGDSLWEIADTYGDPEDWSAIFEANKGEAQPGGGTFDNPNLIYPGQELDLPDPHGQGDPPADTAKETPPPAADQTPDKTPEGKGPEKAPDVHEGGARQPGSPATTPPAPSRTADATPDTTPVPTTSASPDTVPSQPALQEAGEQALAPAAVWAGAGALAAALVGTLAVRRRLQQRRLRPGRRIPMPKGRAAATEQGLRAAQHPTGFDLLGTTLRTLALNLTASGRELPILQAVVLHESRIELHLDSDTVPMKPFTAAPGRQHLWTCSASSPDLADEETLKDADVPYPALVSIGWDAHGHLVLIDLERVGTLQLTGDDDFARHVLQAMAVELANTPLGHLEVAALGETAPGLEVAAPERVARTEDLAESVTNLAAHTNDQRRALAAVGAGSLRAARLLDDAQGAWTPHIVLAQNLPAGPDTDRLHDALAEQPRTAAAIITTAPSGTAADAWTLTCKSPEDTIVLPGSNLPIHLQGLSDAHFADAIDLLTLASSEADVPAPGWVRADPDQDQSEDAGKDEQAGEDGMPAEYTDLEEEALNENEQEQAQAPAVGHSPTPPHTNSAAPGTAEHQPFEQQPANDQEGQEERAVARLSLAEVLAVDDAAQHRAVDEPKNKTTTGSADLPATPVATPYPARPRAGHITVHPSAATVPSPSLPAQPEPGDGPVVKLLGPISIEGATGRLDSSRKSAGIELVAYLALNPGIDHHAIDSALWPGSLVTKQLRNPVISRTRSWLATDHDGNAHLPRVQDSGDSRYRLGPKVTCDWTAFQEHTRKGLADQGEDGDLALRKALALVRGRPFAGINPTRYAWAEPFIQEMVSAITHVAYELSTRRRESGDVPGALWAARQGLLAAEENEMLHRQIFLAHHATGDIDALRNAATTLAKINEQLGGGVDMDAETAELLRNLLPRPTISR